MRSINENIEKNSFVLVNLNIRGLQTNFNNLILFIDGLQSKPHVIICSETHNVPYVSYYNIPGYNVYYNESHVNIANGTVVYVKSTLNQHAEIKVFDNLKVTNVTITLNNNKNVEISAMYRCHDIDKKSFVNAISTFLQDTKYKIQKVTLLLEILI